MFRRRLRAAFEMPAAEGVPVRPALPRRTALGLITGSAAATFTGVSAGTAHAAVPATTGVTYTNTLAEQRAHPHLHKHADGFHYFTATVPEYDRIVLRGATTVQGLTWAPETPTVINQWDLRTRRVPFPAVP